MPTLRDDLEARARRRAALRRALRKAESSGVDTETEDGRRWLKRKVRDYFREGPSDR